MSVSQFIIENTKRNLIWQAMRLYLTKENIMDASNAQRDNET